MNRKEFLKTCGMACLGAGGFGLLLESCAGAKLISGNIAGDDLVVPLSQFEIKQGDKVTYRKYVIIQNNQLQYPICVYRFSADDYSALWMRCTHQGNELTAYGDKLVCAAHGSEFSSRGLVTGSPADKPLRSFPVKITRDQLNISLKAI